MIDVVSTMGEVINKTNITIRAFFPGDLICGKTVTAASNYTRSLILWDCSKYAGFAVECEGLYIVVMFKICIHNL